MIDRSEVAGFATDSDTLQSQDELDSLDSKDILKIFGSRWKH